MNILREKFLLTRAKQKDRKAAELLIENNYEKVFRVLLNFCKNREMAEDLTQEVFAVSWKSLKGFNGDCRYSTWLIRIGYNKYFDRKKKKNIDLVEKSAEEIVEKQADYDNSDNEFFEQGSLIKRAVLELPEKLQEIIALHYYENLSYVEIADILGIPKGTVKSRINTALNKLRKILKADA